MATKTNAIPVPDTPTEQHEEKRLWIGNLDSRVTEYQLIKLLKKYGEVQKFDFLFHKSGPQQGQPRGYCFVTYKTRGEAKHALKTLDGFLALSKQLSVKWAHQKIEDDDSVNSYSSSTTASQTPGEISIATKICAIEAKLKLMEQEKKSDSAVLQPTLSAYTQGITRQSQQKSVSRHQTKPYQKRNFQKKPSRTQVTGPLPAAYITDIVENSWYEWWEEQGFFKPEYNANAKEKFSIILPPPNVTGNLHIGHALTNTIQDALVRWHRMNGRCTVWFPGCDHAGIATQVIVEKILWQEEKKTRHDIGEEKFLEYVWKWKTKKEKVIYEQLRRLGSSLDWSRSVFTMDKRFARAVNEAFIQLHDEGLIFREAKMINWCCHLQSTISDIEVENVEIPGRTQLTIPGYKNSVEFGVMYYIKYKTEPNSSGHEFITVATTRPETIFGDVAVCFHPEATKLTSDEKCCFQNGMTVYNPLNGEKMMLYVDKTVDPNFGTGAVKITPAHDGNDLNRAKEFKIQNFVEVIDDKGLMNENCGEFKGLPRYEARKAVVEKLKGKQLLLREESHAMVLPVCSRSGDVIEQKIKLQWFLKTDSLAQKAMDVVKDGHLQIIPDRYEKLWFRWLNNSQDWCLSRQLAWGHRIPAYKVLNNKSDIWVSARNLEEAIKKAAKQLGVEKNSIKLEQEKDVLDTWFSSSLFPFACMGWPEKTSDLEKFYPLDLMETGNDILLFWIARMVMLGLKLTNVLPFNRVLLHGIVCDIHGRKMSKSLGNVIDPLDIINGISLEQLQEQSKNLYNSGILSDHELKIALDGQKKDYPDGIAPSCADAVRFALCTYNIKDQSLNLDVKRTLRYRLFCNKIWQASKFVFSVLELTDDPSKLDIKNVEHKLTLLDKWILSSLSNMVEKCNEGFTTFTLHSVTNNIHEFFYTRFCDVYLEAVKPIIRSGNKSEIEVVVTVLLTCLHSSLLAMSPFMPFLTEELYQRLPIMDKAISVTVARYPEMKKWSEWKNQPVEDNMDVILGIVQAVRGVCNDFLVKQPAVVVNGSAVMCDEISRFKFILKNLLKLSSLSIVTDHRSLDSEVSKSIKSDVSVHVSSEGNKANQERLILDLSNRKISTNKKLDKLIARMNSPYYLKTKTPETHETYSAKKAALEAKVNELKNNINVLKRLVKS
uniref:Probable RNA-binding protein 18 n=1 Tax=Strigamia maritima TaxID=126957 RepID=T1J7T2_STRMM